MSYPIHQKLVIAIASSALFDLQESNAVFEEKGKDAYIKYQRENLNHILQKGVAFPFIRRFLQINAAYPEQRPVEVVLLSKNDPDTGRRVFNSIKAYGLEITRAGFLNGKSPYQYIPAFNVSLFLSANETDVRKAIEAGYPAGIVMHSNIIDDENDRELRVAFDFDGVIADDESEAVFQKNENLEEFLTHENSKAKIPHNPGPLSELFEKLAFLNRMEAKREASENGYQRILRTAIITARSVMASERMVTTLNTMGISPDETFFLGGIKKQGILEVLKPHIFFDDQITHLGSAAGNIPSVHVPFGIRNKPQ